MTNEDEVRAFLRGSSPPSADDVRSFLRSSEPKPGIGERILSVSRGARDLGQGLTTGLTQAALRIPEGLAKLGSALDPYPQTKGNPLLDRAAAGIRSARESLPEPESTAGMVGNVAGNLIGEGAGYIYGGGLIRKGLGMARPAAQQGQRLAQRLRGGLRETGKDALAFAPIDATAAAVGPENSVAGALGEMTGNERLQRIAQNPLQRTAFEIGTGVAGDLGIRGIVGGARMARQATDITPDVWDGLVEGVKEGTEFVGGAQHGARMPYTDPDPLSAQAVALRRVREGTETPPRLREEDIPSLPAAEPRPESLIEQPPVIGGRGQVKARAEVVVPTADEVRSFLREQNPEKRDRPIKDVGTWIETVRDRAGAQPGAASPEVLGAVARTGAGATAGAAVDRENPARGAAVGGAAALGAPVAGKIARAVDEFANPLPAPSRPKSLDPDPLPEFAESTARRDAFYRQSMDAWDAAQPGNRPGIGDPGTVGRLAAGGVGAAVGVGIDDENPLRGAVVGGAVGVGAGAKIARSLGSKPASLSPAAEKVLSTVSDGTGPSVLRQFSSALNNTPEAMSRLFQKVWNESQGFEKFGKAMGKGEEARLEAKRALAFSSMAQARMIDDFVPVLNAAKPVQREVTALAKAERALELAEAGMPEKGVDLDAARAVVREFGSVPAVRQAADMLRDYYRRLIELKVEAGVLSPEKGRAILESGQRYTPFIPEDAPTKGQGFGTNLANRLPGVRRMREGRLQGKTVDPFNQAILDTIETERRVANQRIANLVGRWTAEMPDAAKPFVRELSGDARAYKGHEVTAIVDGKQKRFEVLDEGLYESWGAMNKDVQNVFIRVLRPMARVFRGGIVNNPEFGMTNFMRDQSFSVGQYDLPMGRVGVGALLGGSIGAFMDEDDAMRSALLGAVMGAGGGAMSSQLQRTLAAMTDILGAETVGAVMGGVAGGFAGDDGIGGTLQGAAMGAVGGAGLGKGLRRAGIVKPNPAVYQEWLNLGGSSGGYFARDSRGAAAIMRELKRQPGFEAADLVSPMTWWDTLQRVNRGIEEATRLARYKHLVAQGVPKEEAAVAGRDVSVDFLQRGSSTSVKTLTQTKAFLGPQLQGWRTAAKMMAKPKNVAVFGATLTAPSIALWMVNKDNPEYWERPQWERNVFWLIPKAEGGFKRFPKPFEPGFIFASLPERMLDFAYQRDPERTKAALGDMLSTTFGDALLPIPTGIAPFAEAFMSGEQGWDRFRNRPVVGYGENRLLPSAQYDESTSSVAMLLERLLPGEQSPKKLDHIMRGLTGTLGSRALDMVSEAARNAGIDSRAAPPDKPNPLTGRFTARTDIVTDDEMFVRRRLQESERVYATVKKHMDRGEVEKAERLIDRNLDALVAIEEMREQKKLLDEAAEARREIRSSRMASNEKREMLTLINRIVADVLKGKPDAMAAPSTMSGSSPR